MPDWRALIRERLLSAGLHPAVEQDIVEELAQHVEDRYRSERARGLPEAEAVEAALAEVAVPGDLAAGLAESLRPPSQPPGRPLLWGPPVPGGDGSDGLSSRTSNRRIVRTARVVSMLWREFVRALRALGQSRTVVANVSITIGLGVGANVAALALLHGALFPSGGTLRDASRLVVIENTGPYVSEGTLHNERLDSRLSTFDLGDLSAGQRSFAALGAFTDKNIAMMVGADRPRNVCRIFVTAETMNVLGVPPTRGRPLAPSDFLANAPGVALVTEDLWRADFASDPAIAERAIRLDEQPFTVVGVLPSRVFSLLQRRTGLFDGGSLDCCVVTPLLRGSGGEAERLYEYLRLHRASPWLNVIGRLQSGVSLDAAQAELSGIAASLAAQNPATNRNRGLRAVLFDTWRTAEIRPLLLMLAVAAALTFIVACASAAGLLMTETVRRAPEFATLYALGADPMQLMGAVVARSVAWSLPGAVLGVICAEVTLGLIRWGASTGADSPAALAQGPVVLVAGLALALLAGVASACIVSWTLRRQNFAELLREGGHSTSMGRRRGRATSVLIMLQVTAATVLALGAALLLQSVRNLNAVDYGFDLAKGLAVQVRLPRSTFPRSTQQAAFFQQALSRIRALPGVSAAGVSVAPPLTDYSMTLAGGLTVTTPARSQSINQLSGQFITSGYFETLSQKLVRGRFISEQDEESHAPVAVVDEAFCRKFIGDADPLASTMSFGPTVFSIVGVVRTARHAVATEAEDNATAYLPFDRSPSPPVWSFLVVQTSRDPAALAGAVVREVSSVDSAAIVDDPQRFTELLAAKTAERRRILGLLGAFAAIVVLLTAQSLAAAIGQFVTAHSRDIAIRFAIGAERRHIVAVTLKGLAWALGAGLLAGLAGAWALGRTLTSQLYGLTAGDPRTLASVIGLLVTMAVVAAAGPLRRALRIDPVMTIRGL
jgi:putative ABC transport system permease protein